MNASTTALSLARLRAEGWTVDVVERWVPGRGVNTRRDLFGIIDLLAVRGDVTLGVQTTTRGEISRRVHKIADAECIGALREAGWQLVVHGWDQPGGHATRYRLHEVDVS